MAELVDTPLIDVWFYSRAGWMDERHADNPNTILATIDMTLERLGPSYALWHVGPPETSQWCLRRYRKDDYGHVTMLIRYYRTKEAAEMIAIHNA